MINRINMVKPHIRNNRLIWGMTRQRRPESSRTHGFSMTFNNPGSFL
jgi:hypothetical protein